MERVGCSGNGQTGWDFAVSELLGNALLGNPCAPESAFLKNLLRSWVPATKSQPMTTLTTTVNRHIDILLTLPILPIVFHFFSHIFKVCDFALLLDCPSTVLPPTSI